MQSYQTFKSVLYAKIHSFLVKILNLIFLCSTFYSVFYLPTFQETVFCIHPISPGKVLAKTGEEIILGM